MKVRDAKTGRFVKNSPEVHAKLDPIWRKVPYKSWLVVHKYYLIFGAIYIVACLAAGALGGFLGARYGLN